MSEEPVSTAILRQTLTCETMDVRPAAMPPHFRYLSSEEEEGHVAWEQDWARAGKL